jgi:ligand-binding sensor domain-containing protein/DNA-binding CsgD family transcriptional regulator
MKKSCIAVFLLITLLKVSGQNTVGLPDVVNHPKKVYGGGLQNWDISQDEAGNIFVANNEGLLSFDGRYWALHPLPNRTIVRSVQVGRNGKIFVGGQDELGYFEPDKGGRLIYRSLLNKIPANELAFGDVWDIIQINQDIWFRTAKRIFKYSGSAMAVFPAASEWGFLGAVNGKLYAQDFEKGLLIYENGAWRTLFARNPSPTNDAITGLHAIDGNQLMVIHLKGGIFISDGKGLKRMTHPNLAVIQSARIYATEKLPDGRFALATNTNGIYIIDQTGKRIQHFGLREGLQNNNVLSIRADRNNNLWLGLDNGIDYIAYNSAIKRIDPSEGKMAAYSCLVQNGILYVGTSNGTWKTTLDNLPDLSFSQQPFLTIENTKGQAWSITEINNQILLGHHEGVFRIQQSKAVPVLLGKGFWNFKPLSATYPTSKILAGNYQGLQLIDYSSERFVPGKTFSPFEESSRYVVIDGEQNIWISHPYHGVFRLQRDTGHATQWKTYGVAEGLPSQLNNHIFKVLEQMVVGTEKGVYRYDPKADRFEADPTYAKWLGNQSIRYLQDDATGNIWFVHEKTVGWIDRSSANTSIVYLPELKKKLLSGFEFIYPYNDNNVFMAGEAGLYHVNLSKYRKQQENLEVSIRGVRLGLHSDSLLFGGFGLLDENSKVTIGPNERNIRFEYSTAPITDPESLEYSYRLAGFEDQWSEWTKRTEKEFTNLPPGNYQFEVKARNNLGSESKPVSFPFLLSSPWYQTPIAWIFYLLLAGGLFFWRYRFLQNKFRRQQLLFEEEQKKLQYILELEKTRAESELISVKSQNLETEIQFKNSELASTAMHLVKKGELITRLKTELNQLIRRVDVPAAQTEVKKMIKQLEEDDQIDQEWDQFAKHFDKVHSDFVMQLKTKHPDISPNEVKLCSYLRMNLSSKEIAQLLNISVRGVEISRYRLRKKLNLQGGENLFDYLIQLQKG